MFKLKVDIQQREHKRIPSGRIIEVKKEIEEKKIIEATVVDYSSGGCCLIIITEQSPKLKEFYNLDMTKVDIKLGLKKAKVMWYKELVNNTFMIGFMYTN